jgi:hypothetical protein
MRRTTSRTLRSSIVTVAVGLALVAGTTATASARNPRPTEAQATKVAQRLAERAADGLRTFGIFEIEHISVSCAHPFGAGPRSLTCAYALYIHNTQDGSGQICLNSVYVSKTPTGRVRGRFGTQSCF